MGRPPSNGGPAFRFTPSEVAEMETILQEHNNTIPPRELFATLAEKFSNSPVRLGKITVQMKQVWNWFQNKRYALKARSNKSPAKLDVTPLQMVPPLQHAQPVPKAPAFQPIAAVCQEVINNPASHFPRLLAPHSGKTTNNMEYEARSARDGAWYDIAAFLSVRNMDTDDPEVLVRFVGLTPEEDEFVKVSKHVRHRSLPCEATECVAVLPGDLILCFQEATEQALYFDAHVLDVQRMKHDIRGCRCRFLVRYDHDLSEEIVPLRKICRRPETDYRLQIYQALQELPGQQKKAAGIESSKCSVPIVSSSLAESAPMAEKVEDNTLAPTQPFVNQQKLTTISSSPASLKEKASTLEKANENVTIGSVARKAGEMLEKDAKKPRMSDAKENPAAESGSTVLVKLEAEKQAGTQTVTITPDADKQAGNHTTSPPVIKPVSEADDSTANKVPSPALKDPASVVTATATKSSLSPAHEVETAVAKEAVASTDPKDPKSSSAADAQDPNNASSTAAALTCQGQTQTQTNGHTTNSSGNNSDVPVGAQQCF